MITDLARFMMMVENRLSSGRGGLESSALALASTNQALGFDVHMSLADLPA
jgi:hypothetical protein